MMDKASLKRLLGELPLTAEMYWQLRQNGKPLNRSFSLRHASQMRCRNGADCGICLASSSPTQLGIAPKKVLIFVTLRYWIEHAALMGMALAGLGHEVTLAYLPYANWRKPLQPLRPAPPQRLRQSVLTQAQPYLNAVSLAGRASFPGACPRQLEEAIRQSRAARCAVHPAGRRRRPAERAVPPAPGARPAQPAQLP